ncbi:hypothetical protein PHYBLDRAFT_138547 [Phycomyces blakesleeanus NRRL 1555(-)]|uniref:Uncharacterized protein n=1 Tax=Phycomyces blakesleeanus (strain ATCC 8743b / DSM 1359 / FGSC 10004 / NBRC 33097 / NRRL 1555) TaxID=763407 RepID=A0A163ER84_PHYB8|nr:hypothetical protein PHYBLDRAFT_138547 [Phycomyces blakesleeanus NRRL 1555(-)]OAD81000.1 hypothetical protein PHYBLDRAFT_138547 [Phycomyces blakesleeanus NRRL 1555(-)]|eukprot:XP_018299040.1 hypothetical protein PHYBLDRAFT_138547 [Phycomyces blakesleeanus NRRL 1555(-)]
MWPLIKNRPLAKQALESSTLAMVACHHADLGPRSPIIMSKAVQKMDQFTYINADGGFGPSSRSGGPRGHNLWVLKPYYRKSLSDWQSFYGVHVNEL